MTLTLTFRMDQSSCKYVNRKLIYELISDSISNVHPICRYSLDISWIAPDLDLDL